MRSFCTLAPLSRNEIAILKLNHSLQTDNHKMKKTETYEWFITAVRIARGDHVDQENASADFDELPVRCGRCV